MTIQAKIIADSTNHKDIRLTTLQLLYPRYIHAELLTHRMLSRNASSSRAIPIERQMDSIIANPVYPHYCGKNQKGMQAGDLLDPQEQHRVFQVVDEHRTASLQCARKLLEIGLHKQSTNRYLEAHSHISVLVSATEWNNFFALRCHKDAQPEIRALAESIKCALSKNEPQFLQDGEWHLPFVTEEEKVELGLKEQLMLSVARCATISYARSQNEIGLHKAVEIYERLTKSTPIHASPFEHQAKPIADSNEATHITLADNELWCGNFRGWMQYRHTLEKNYIPY